ncbi:COX15/CtaA family protein [Litorihabitans aurantiacus]|uniref:Protein required for cytochrome oxidase assembly n=1 Tax=Litorihabitans aurantiacus TaxID=1930061 RepID=A0AA37XEC5_9MICO|nr:COX15/CtaA family protein [Litorihabitans aurantiacus]GMA31639.1 protein required for cytochrome oxidase assembly [Litorihabitans aurantiacus]
MTFVVAVANLVAQSVIILTGGVVRLTASGLGCSTWPECEPGEFTPVFHEATTLHPFIEFGNRTLTGVLVVIALALAVLILFSPATRARTVRFRILGLVPLVGVLVQALIGGITVLVDLHPAVVGGHFLISAALVWGSAVLVARLREGDGARRPRLLASGWRAAVLRAVPAGFGLLTAVVVVLGVITTGAGPHSGDSEVGYRFPVDPALMARLHAVSVWVFVLALAGVLVVLHHRGVRAAETTSDADDADARTTLARVRRTWWILAVVTLAQGGIGYTQYFTGLPIGLVAIHLIGSAGLVTAVTFAVLSLRTRGAAEDADTPWASGRDHVRA